MSRKLKREKERRVPEWASETKIPLLYRFVLVNDITGQRFGRLEAIDAFQIINSRMHWVCICDCGELRTVCGGNLREGNTKSCGCLRNELASARMVKWHEAQKQRKNAKPRMFADPLDYFHTSQRNKIQSDRT